jgi:monothiol glutaredoxin
MAPPGQIRVQGASAVTGVKWLFISFHLERAHAMSNVQETLRDQVTKNRVVLYMKGTPQFPQCGFSATVAEILKRSGVDEYFSVNVLADPEIRQGIKEFSDWPTIPQLYVDGEFVGGCDIIREMYASGELQKVLAPQTA